MKYGSCRFVVIFILLICSQKIYATNYYLSAAGNDINAGATIQQPWRTIERLNKQPLKPGDTVLFKRGNSFYGELICKFSGSKNRPIVYCAYGAGAIPIITGAIEIKNLQLFKNEIYAASCKQNIKAVFTNNQQQFLARYPNVNFNIMQNGVGNPVSFIDSNLTQPNGYWKGANIRFRTWDWEVRTSTINSFANNIVTINDSSTNNLAKGWGYYFDNKIELLDTIGEWFYDKDTQQLFIYSITKPSVTIAAVLLLNGVTIEKNIHHVTITQLQVEQFFNNGITLAGNNAYISISNNTIQQIDKTGVFINEVALHCDVSNNKITQINGRGIFALEPEHLLIEKNTVSNIGNIMGYGFSGVNNMIGIVIANNEVAKDSVSHIARHNTIRKNKVDSIGYVGIRMDGANSMLEYNTVNNVMYKLSDGAAIYTWALSKYYSHDNVIRYNIVSNVKGDNYGTPNGEAAANGIYIDNNCYKILVQNNTVYNVSASGMHINSDACNNTLEHNTIYNCQTGVSVAEWAKPKATFGNTVQHNTFFMLHKEQFGVYLINFLLPTTASMAAFNNNTYYHFWSDTLMKDVYNSRDKAGNVYRNTNAYTLSGWQHKFGYESTGKSINKMNGINRIAESRLLYNNTDSIQTIQLSGKKYYSLQAKKLNEVIIMPYQSVIIISSK